MLEERNCSPFIMHRYFNSARERGTIRANETGRIYRGNVADIYYFIIFTQAGILLSFYLLFAIINSSIGYVNVCFARRELKCGIDILIIFLYCYVGKSIMCLYIRIHI